MAATKYVPHDRYAKDIAGMPVFAAVTPLAILIGPESQAGAVPSDPDNCAIALGCRVQLQTPYVQVGRSRTDLALPHPQGVTKRGYGRTKWAVIRFFNPPSARNLVIATDTGQLDGLAIVVELLPPRPSTLYAAKAARRRTVTGRRHPARGKRGQDKLTLLGVRNLNGQRPSK